MEVENGRLRENTFRLRLNNNHSKRPSSLWLNRLCNLKQESVAVKVPSFSAENGHFAVVAQLVATLTPAVRQVSNFRNTDP